MAGERSAGVPAGGGALAISHKGNLLPYTFLEAHKEKVDSRAKAPHLCGE